MLKLKLILLSLFMIFSYQKISSQNFNKEDLKTTEKNKLNHNQKFSSEKSNTAKASYGTPPNLNWYKHFGGSSADDVNAMVTDNAGNIYVTGAYSGEISISGNTYTSAGTKEAFVVKLDNSGNVIWYKSIPAGSGNQTYSSDICIDNNANIYITGYFTGTVTMGTNSLVPNGTFYTLFYAKLDSQGNILSADKHIYNSDEIGKKIGVDNSGNIYIIGSNSMAANYSLHSSNLLKINQSSGIFVYDNTFDLGFNDFEIHNDTIYYSGVVQNGDDTILNSGISLLSPVSYNDVFIAASDLSGNFTWAQTAQHSAGFGDSRDDRIALDNNGNIFLTGSYRTNLTFGTFSINSSMGLYLAKFDNDGTCQWLNDLSGKNTFVALATDASGNVFVNNNDSLKKFNANGNAVFTHAINKKLSDIEISSNDKIILGGNDDGIIYVEQLDATANQEWIIQSGGNSATSYVYAMTVDSSGYVYSLNYTSNEIEFATSHTVSKGLFMVKQSGQGQVMWIKEFGDCNYSGRHMNNLMISPDNQFIYLTGNFKGNLSVPGGTNLTSAKDNIFLLKYDLDGNFSWSVQEDFRNQDFYLAPDYSGNIIISGTFSDTVDISGTSLISQGELDGFVAKYNSSGNMLWAFSAGGSSVEYSAYVAVDGNDNIYFTGEFTSENITFNSTPYTMTEGNGNIIFAKLSSSGSVKWINSYAASNHAWHDGVSWPTGIITDFDGNTYMKGAFSYTAEFGNITLSNPNSYYNKFITKIDSSGNVLWANGITQNQTNFDFDYNQFDIDGNGNVYFGMQASDAYNFGNTYQYTPVNPNNLFVAKYSTNGSLEWVEEFEGSNVSSSYLSSVAVYGNSNVFVGGYYSTQLSLQNQNITTDDYNTHGFLAMFGPDITTSVKNIYNKSELEIYPNPANDIIYLSNEDLNYSLYKIYSIDGRLIKSGELNNNKSVDISELNSATYFIKIQSNKGEFYKKFIKN